MSEEKVKHDRELVNKRYGASNIYKLEIMSFQLYEYRMQVFASVAQKSFSFIAMIKLFFKYKICILFICCLIYYYYIFQFTSSKDTKNGKFREKEFKPRNSLLTDLLEIKHFKSIRHLFLAMFISWLMNNMFHHYYGPSR